MKEKELHIDGIDKIILKNLMKDARTPILSIARKLAYLEQPYIKDCVN